MKKFIFITSLLIGSIVCGFAQGEIEQTSFRKNEVALNATSFFNSFISLNDNDLPVGNYFLNYRRYFNPKLALRMGLNASQSKSSNPNFFDSRISNYGLRLGIQWNKTITPKWKLLSGIDLLGGYQSSEFISQNTFSGYQTPIIINQITAFNGFSYGVGPYLGVQYHLNDHIGFFTESLFYFTSRKLNRTVSQEVTEGSIVTTNEEDSSVQTSWNYNIGLPTSIFFFVKF